MIKISKLVEIAQKKLTPDDRIQKNFIAYYAERDRHINGFLLLSNKKVMFVEEKGFLRKSYDVVLEVPYEKVAEITIENRYRLGVADAEGNKMSFTFSAPLTAAVVQDALKDLM